MFKIIFGKFVTILGGAHTESSVFEAVLSETVVGPFPTWGMKHFKRANMVRQKLVSF